MQKIEDIPKNQLEILREILKEIDEKIKGERGIMYSDIINFIIRHNYRGEIYNQLILWCNSKIRLGLIFVEL